MTTNKIIDLLAKNERQLGGLVEYWDDYCIGLCDVNDVSSIFKLPISEMQKLNDIAESIRKSLPVS